MPRLEKTNGSSTTFGADPEFFLKDEHGCPVPAFGLFGGKKGEGLLLGTPSTLGKEHELRYLEDGAAVELNIPICYEFSNIFTNILEYRNYFVKSKLAKKKLAILDGAVARFDKQVLNTNPLAKVMGCEPDYDAYDNGAARRPFLIEEFGDLRFAGGHLHFGIKPWPEQIPKHIFVQFLDLFLGTFLFKFDNQAERKKFYGLPGLFRPTSYGVEYRTPSADLITNLWGNADLSKTLEVCRQFINYVSLSVQNEGYLDNLSDLYMNLVDWGSLKELLSKDTWNEKQGRDAKLIAKAGCRKLGITFREVW